MKKKNNLIQAMGHTPKSGQDQKVNALDVLFQIKNA